MSDETSDRDSSLLYEPDDTCPLPVLLGVAGQGLLLVLAPIVMVVIVTTRAGGQDDNYLAWAIFACLIISGTLTALQASRVGRFGAGHILLMGPTLNFAAVAALALSAGGPALLASLTVASSLLYLMLAFWLPLLRRVITPVVSGTVIMLISVSVLPLGVGRIREVPADAPAAAGPAITLIVVAVTVVMGLRAPHRWRIWSLVASIAAGWLMAVALGVYDPGPVIDAAWIGWPGGSLPGVDLGFGLDFWTLLPAFAIITLVGGVKNIADSVTVQQASQRNPRVTDFRLVQGSLNTNGLGILFAGAVGTPPTTVYSSFSATLITSTAVAARRVGYVVGAGLALLAVSPKVTAIFVSIPNPVMGAVVIVATGGFFISGIRTVLKDGLDAPKAVVAAVSFAVGASLDRQGILSHLTGERWSALLDNGVVLGAVTAVLLTLFIQFTSPVRQARLEVDLSVNSLPEIDDFLCRIASRMRWNDTSITRLRSAGEETLMSLIEPDATASEDGPARFIVIARPGDNLVELEFLSVFDEENLEDRLAYLSEEVEGTQSLEAEISLRLLRHYASSVHHQKFYGLDVVTVVVRGSN